MNFSKISNQRWFWLPRMETAKFKCYNFYDCYLDMCDNLIYNVICWFICVYLIYFCKIFHSIIFLLRIKYILMKMNLHLRAALAVDTWGGGFCNKLTNSMLSPANSIADLPLQIHTVIYIKYYQHSKFRNTFTSQSHTWIVFVNCIFTYSEI